MPIDVICPNGHELKIKEKYAGKTGLCPKCRASIQVPALVPSTIDELIDLVPRAQVASAADASVYDDDDDPMQQRLGHSPSRVGESLLSSASLVKHQKVCAKCHQPAPSWYATCPNCGQFFPRE